MKGAAKARTLLLQSGAIAGLLGGATVALAQAGGGAPPAIEGPSSPESEAGRAAYAQYCASCHGSELTNGQFAPALKGRDFLVKWGGQPLSELMEYIHASMPPGNAGSLPEST